MCVVRQRSTSPLPPQALEEERVAASLFVSIRHFSSFIFSFLFSFSLGGLGGNGNKWLRELIQRIRSLTAPFLYPTAPLLYRFLHSLQVLWDHFIFAISVYLVCFRTHI